MMPIQRAEGCLTDLTFDAWSSDELSVQERERAAAHMSTCARCRVRRTQLQAVRDEFYAAAPSFHELAQRSQPQRAKRVSGWLFSLAVAASLALMFTPVMRPGTRQKGGPTLGYFVKRAERVFKGDRDSALQPGDLIRFTYSTQEPRYLALFGRDAQSASIYFPADSDQAVRVQSQVDVGLDFSLELDAAGSVEEVHALFCRSGYQPRPLLRLLRDTGELPVPPDCQKVSLTLQKAARP